ncbi:arginine--tRNA ligase [Methanolinea mesophila]|uniref:arginine--tRNA ligase n=1 Tax=Methanolinea mesophila TaxID=547055 RepID=UPI001AE57B25|nr:arginine--tRNA ligase [Methanolinea mesophila]
MYRDVYLAIERELRSMTGILDIALTDGGEHADLASPVAFALAKERRKAPAAIAKELADQLSEFAAKNGITVEAAGPYLNFRLGDDHVRQAVRDALAPGYGDLPALPERLVLEHTSANPNGPLHVGHIRNSIIGDTLARCLRKAGHALEVQYYVNDMGRQIAIVAWGFTNLPNEPAPDEKGDHHVARIYIAANRALEADPEIVSSVDRLMQQVEKGDPATVRLFRGAVTECLDGFKVTMARLNVRHDRFVWESDFVRNGDTDRLLGRISHMKEVHQDDRLWVDLTEAGYEKEYVLRRSDGTSVYAARDLAYHIWKGRNFGRMIDVLGADHKLIGGQLIATLRLIGEQYPEIVYFEFVSLPEGSMSTRAGKFVSADELMDEVTARAFHEVTVRRPELPEEERQQIARSVAISAIRYDIVKISPEKSTVFDWKEALDFERQSGPYIQYAHARACSILEKAGAFEPAFELASPSEIALAKQIARFPFVLEKVAGELKPHMLATYARDLADLFNAFYHYEPVLKSEGITRASRLTLVKATQNTLQEALGTLGIDALRTM